MVCCLVVAVVVVLRCAERADPENGRLLPPSISLLLAWTTLFRSPRTLSNYLGYVKTACLLCEKPVTVRLCSQCKEFATRTLHLQVFDCPALKRAKDSVSKSGAFTSRPKMWLRRKRVHEMVAWCQEHPGHPMLDTYVALYLTAYAFLLRLPSEALPITVGHDSGPCAIFREGEKLVLQLKRRSACSCLCTLPIHVTLSDWDVFAGRISRPAVD